MTVAASNYNAIVEKLYIAYFGRPADPGGMAYYTALLSAANAPTTSAGFVAALVGNTNTTVAAVVKGFAASTEAAALYPSTLSISAQVALVYQYALGRTADAGGLAYWTNEIAAGRQTLASAAIVILQAGEGDASVDGPSVAVRTSAALAFTASLDQPAEIAAYSGAAAAAAARAWLLPVNGTTPANNTQAAIDTTILVIQGVNPTNPGGGGGGGGQTFALLATADTFAGGAGADIFTAATGTFGAGDNLDGAGGTDTLTVNQTGNLDTTGTTVANIETVNVTASGTLNLAAAGWTGLTALNATTTSGNNATIVVPAAAAVSYTGQNIAAGNVIINGGTTVNATTTGDTTGTLTIGGVTAPSGAVTVNVGSNGATTMGAIAVTAGGAVNITQTANNANGTTTTMGAVTANGGANTTAVTVTNARAATAGGLVAGVTDNSITVNDVNNASTTLAGKITSVSATGFTTLSINDNALATLSLTGGSGNVTIGNGNLNLNARTNFALAVMVNGETGGSLIDSGVYTSLAITTTGADSRFANISQAAVISLSVAGSQTLTLTSTAGMAALATVTVSGSAGLVADVSGHATTTAVNTSATTGASTITLDGTKATFTGGSGVDKVTIMTGLTKAMDLGAGDDTLTIGALIPTAALAGGQGTDTLSIDATAAQTASGSGTFAGLVTGFENLIVTGATNQTLNLAVLGNYNSVQTSGGNGITFDNMSPGGTLTLDGAGTRYVVGATNFGGGSDSFNLKLSADASAAGTNFASTGITAAGVENLVISTADTQAAGPSGAFNHSVTITDTTNANKSIVVSGSAGLTLTDTGTGLTSVDASGITKGGFSWTSSSLSGPATVKGSATGTNTVDVSASFQAVTYTGGSGADTITVGHQAAHSLTGGGGVDHFVFNTANASALAGMTTITDYRAAGGANAGALDVIDISGITTVASNISTVQDFSTQASLAAALNVIANAATTSNGLSVFIYGGNEYAYVESTGATSTYAAGDTVIKLVGTPFAAGTSIVGLGIDGV
ncbi:MAG: DUF4214 domain-containing protein [Pseudomonadota bacterium]